MNISSEIILHESTYDWLNPVKESHICPTVPYIHAYQFTIFCEWFIFICSHSYVLIPFTHTSIHRQWRPPPLMMIYLQPCWAASKLLQSSCCLSRDPSHPQVDGGDGALVVWATVGSPLGAWRLEYACKCYENMSIYKEIRIEVFECI